MNAVKTVYLMTLMMALFLLIGYLLGGNTGMTIALVFSLLMNFGSFWFSDKIVLAMYRAKEVNRESAPKFYDMVESLARQSRLDGRRMQIPKREVIDPHRAALEWHQGNVFRRVQVAPAHIQAARFERKFRHTDNEPARRCLVRGQANLFLCEDRCHELIVGRQMTLRPLMNCLCRPGSIPTVLA